MPDPIEALHAKAIDAASENDKAWFEANPDRLWRIRDPIPMEMNGPLEPAAPGYTNRMVVAKITDAARARFVIQMEAVVPNEGATDAALERIMFTVFPKWLTQVRKMRRAAKA